MCLGDGLKSSAKVTSVEVNAVGVGLVDDEPHRGAGDTIEGGQEVEERDAVAARSCRVEASGQLADARARQSRMTDRAVARGPAAEGGVGAARLRGRHRESPVRDVRQARVSSAITRSSSVGITQTASPASWRLIRASAARV